MTHPTAQDAMVGWPARWMSSVGREQPNHHSGLDVTDHVPVGLDLSRAPISTPTPPLNRAPDSHNAPQNHADLPLESSKNLIHSLKVKKVGHSSPLLEEKFPYHKDVVILHPHPPAVPSCSRTTPSCLSGSRAPEEDNHVQPPPVSSCGTEAVAPSRGNTKTNNHSCPCNASSTPSVPPTSLNGTSRPSEGTQVSQHINDNSVWEDGATETSPLTTTNGEVGRFRVNGVAVMAAAKEETVAEAEEEEEEEGEGDAGEGEDEEEEEEGEDNDTKCGLGKWCSPPCVQRLANKQMFLMVFCLTSVLQGMFYTYFVSVLTTIEKLFQLKSKTTGIIMSATEMGQIGGALLLTYYGGHGHRPKWIGWGIVLFAFCALLCSLPHFLFGPDLLKKHIEMTSSEGNPLDMANTCKLPQTNVSVLVPLSGGAGTWVLDFNSDNRSLPEKLPEEGPCESSDSYGVLAIFFLSLLGVGIGQTAAYNLGIPYIDDNVDNRETPLYFAGTSGVRILGPTLGFVLGSVCTRLYVNPMTDPGITTNDPRWIGAWWLGLVFVSVALFLTSTAMFAFPRRLPSSPKAVRTVFKAPLRNPSLRDFPRAVRRLLKNEILMLRTASSVLHILPIAGLYTFLPKYLESQFRLPVHSAAMVSGIGGILVMGVGIFASGVLIRRAKPTARTVSGWIALTALVYSIGMIILMFVGCTPDDFVDLEESESQGKHFTFPCERKCGNCDNNLYAPVCDSEKKTHFSACHLGCRNATIGAGSNRLLFSDCECLAEGATAELRLCELNCSNFVWYVIIFSFFVLIHSTSEVGGMLVTLRCVDPKDKAMALGLISVAIGLFGNVPCPIIYGSVVDSACIQWKVRCKEMGACQLYDSDIFRMFFHGITGAVMLLAFIVDVVVWHKAKSVSFNEDEEGQEEATLMNPPSLSQSPSTPPVVIEPTPTTSTAVEISPVGSTSEEASVSQEGVQPESCV
ncbi:solute carrier organic anion transporter family member 74D-like isoform X1 [Macrobrachium nipponense]|uniref:solute carrier organic anion transporter family member 74D-like isoform X1 n=2 Tax=Macrobrachium nipponense TaxID=159736 RepID=UPI0030C81B9A